MESRRFEKTNPTTGEVIRAYPVADAAEVAEVVCQSRRAQTDWASLSLSRRAEIMHAIAGRLYAQADALARTVSLETGKPLSDAMMADVGVAVHVFAFYAKVGRRMLKPRSLRPDWVSLLSGRTHEEIRRPHGVVGLITPWNYPLAIAASGMAAALMAGNGVILKPSELAPQTGLDLVAQVRSVLQDEGVLPDLVQAISGDGETGAALVGSAIDAAVFTGSHATGMKVLAAMQGKPVSLELGGSDPMLVLPGLPEGEIPAVASYALWGRFVNAGQACAAVKRLYVPRTLHDRLLAALQEKLQGIRVGPPEDAGMHVGPLISERQRDLLHAQVQDAINRGARVLVGGHPLPGPGYFYAPTLLADVSPDARVLTEETFGPVLPVVPYETVDEAVSLANASSYGLTASVFGPADEARQVAERLHCGTVVMNDVGTSNYAMLCAPWGGWKQSGPGISHGERALLDMTRAQIISRNHLFGWPWFGKPLWHFGCQPCRLEDSRALMGLASQRPQAMFSPRTLLAVWRNRAETKL